MKKTLFTIILIIILSLSLATGAYCAQGDIFSDIDGFLAAQGKVVGGERIYSAAMSGGGSFSIKKDGGNIVFKVETYTPIEDYREGYDFSIIVTPALDGNYEWVCNTEDGNGVTSSRGKMTGGDNSATTIICDEYDGDEYIKRSILENAQNFRNTLVLAIANDLNYYLDKNLDAIGTNPLFFCHGGHTFGEWIYQKNAKVGVNGTEKRQCTRCFATEEREKAGTMLTMQPGGSTFIPPEQETVPQPQPKPEIQTPQTPSVSDDPIPAPAVDPDISTDVSSDTDKTDEGSDPSRPSYVTPLIIAIVAVVVIVAAAFVFMSMRAKKPAEESDTFDATDEDFE